jgi:hypothetical protein
MSRHRRTLRLGARAGGGPGAVAALLYADGCRWRRDAPDPRGLLAGDDGVVDGEEFIAADVASFDAIDKNKDHQIDLAELTAYVAQYSD